MTARAFVSILMALTLLFYAGSSPAQDVSRHFSKIVTDWERTLDNTWRYIDAPVHFEERNREHRTLLARIRKSAQLAATSAAANVAKQQRLMEALGPPPKDGDPPEQPEIATQRAKYI